MLFIIKTLFMGKIKLDKKGKRDDEDYVIYTETHRRRKYTKKSITAGSWTIKENQIYLNFLKLHPQLFETEFVRRSSKVFRKMSSLLRRRDPEQCRSHHQKLILKCGANIQKVINRLAQKIDRSKQKQLMNVRRRQSKQGQKTQGYTGEKTEIEFQQARITYGQQGQINIIVKLDNLTTW